MNSRHTPTSTAPLIGGAAIRAAREAADLTQTELGQRCGGVTKASVSSWESGLTRPDPANAMKLSEVLGITLEQIYAPTPKAAA